MYANISKTTRKLVYRRDGFQCAMCGSTRYLQIHHYIPRGKGGADSPQNLITLCSDCHALAHGNNTLGLPDFTKEGIEHEICVYLADIYAPDWRPFMSLTEWLKSDKEGDESGGP